MLNPESTNILLFALSYFLLQTDALVVEKAITDDPILLPEDNEEQITIKVQSSSKTISYRLGKVRYISDLVAITLLP